MDKIPAGTPVPTVEYETCIRCDGSLYRGVSADGQRRGQWHHYDRRMRHEPELYEVGEEALIVDLEIKDSAEIAASHRDRYDEAGGGDAE